MPLKKTPINLFTNKTENLRPLKASFKIQFAMRFSKKQKFVKIWLYHSKKYDQLNTSVKKILHPKYYFKRFRIAYKLYLSYCLNYKIINLFKCQQFITFMTIVKKDLLNSFVRDFNKVYINLKRLIRRYFLRQRNLNGCLIKKFIIKSPRRPFKKRGIKLKSYIDRRKEKIAKLKIKQREKRKYNKYFKPQGIGLRPKLNLRPLVRYIQKSINFTREKIYLASQKREKKIKRKIENKVRILLKLEKEVKKKRLNLKFNY